MGRRTRDPLRPLVFQILLLLHEEPRHGYGIMQEVNDRAGRNLILGPGTLYRTLRQMRERGLIAETAEGSERQRVYRLTDAGERAARREAERMAELVDRARRGSLLH